jgi:hypothetical protein
MKKFFLIAILLLTSASAALAQKAYEPKKHSTERFNLMNAIRTYDTLRDEKLIYESFSTAALRVQGNWAYANVEQLKSEVVTYGQAHVFLQKVRGKWQVAFSTHNDTNEVAVDALARLRKKNKTFPKGLATFAMKYLAG